MEPVKSDEVKAEAERGFGEILELWHGGKWDALFERTFSGGSQTRENFVGRISTAPSRPACCWQQKQEVTVTVKKEKSVVVRAKIGLEGVGDIQYRARSFKLKKEDGVWRMSRSDVLSLAGASKKKGWKRRGKTRVR
jgi:hypothetical protein